MAKKLKENVHVNDEHGHAHAFGPAYGNADDVPEWAEKALGSNPLLWEGSDVADPPRLSDPGNSGSVTVNDGVEEPKPRYEAEAEERERRESERKAAEERASARRGGGRPAPTTATAPSEGAAVAADAESRPRAR